MVIALAVAVGTVVVFVAGIYVGTKVEERRPDMNQAIDRAVREGARAVQEQTADLIRQIRDEWND